MTTSDEKQQPPNDIVRQLGRQKTRRCGVLGENISATIVGACTFCWYQLNKEIMQKLIKKLSKLSPFE